MQPDDNTKDSELDFNQLDQEINQLMQQKPTQPELAENSDGTDEQSADTWSSIASQLKPESKSSRPNNQDDRDQNSQQATPAKKPVQPQKPRGFAMDVIHPTQAPARQPIKPEQEKSLPVGDDYLISATGTPDKITDGKPEKVISGYGAGGFSTKESEQIEKNINQASTISTEKQNIEKEVKKFEDEPVEISSSDQDSEVKPSFESGALPANNLVKQAAQEDSTDDETSANSSAMFDTKDYVQPLKPPVKAKKSNETLWVIILVILIIILIGLGAGYYLFILGR